jgi:MoxR-like ATPase
MKAQLAVATTPALGRLHSVRSSLRARFLERDHVIDLLLAALLARLHVFVLGPPGTGKSALASAIVSSVEGTTGFTWLMSKFTTPEDVFGPLSLQALQQGRFERLTTKKLPEAHVALLDEIFKSNSAILNACLTLMNERQFMNGTAVVDCPLITLIGASNELPDGDDLEALFDRFALRLVVPYIADPDNVKRLLADRNNVVAAATMTLDELIECQNEADAVDVPDAFIDVLVDAVKPKLEEQGVRASDRRWQQIIRFLQAYAYLDGRNAVTVDHCDILPDLLWRDPASRPAIVATVAAASNPTAARAAEIVDAAKEKVQNLKTPEREPQKRAEWLSAASLVGDELDSMLKELSALGTSRKVQDALASVTKLKKRIAEQVNAMYSTGA